MSVIEDIEVEMIARYQPAYLNKFMIALIENYLLYHDLNGASYYEFTDSITKYLQQQWQPFESKNLCDLGPQILESKYFNQQLFEVIDLQN